MALHWMRGLPSFLLVSFTLVGLAPTASAITHSSCSKGFGLDQAASCSFTVSCPSSCSFSVEVKVTGTGLVYGKLYDSGGTQWASCFQRQLSSCTGSNGSGLNSAGSMTFTCYNYEPSQALLTGGSEANGGSLECRSY